MEHPTRPTENYGIFFHVPVELFTDRPAFEALVRTYTEQSAEKVKLDGYRLGEKITEDRMYQKWEENEIWPDASGHGMFVRCPEDEAEVVGVHIAWRCYREPA